MNPERDPIGAYCEPDVTVWPFTNKDAAEACRARLCAQRDRDGMPERYRVVKRTISAMGVKVPMWCLCIIYDGGAQ